jgi:transcriptional adapter 3
VPPPPIPGPSKPTDVNEDFSKSKQPSQVLVSTFYASIEPWIRNIKEEDIGFLEYTGDEVEPYVVPKLGRHYSEVWEDEDIAQDMPPLPGFTVTRTGGSEGLASAPTPKWDPSTLAEPDLLAELKGHGPLTERLVSALLPMPDMTVWKGVKAAEDAMEGRPGGSGAAAAKREKVNVALLEDRIRDTMRFHGLLEATVSFLGLSLHILMARLSGYIVKQPDYTEKVDDPIATALRQAQRELRRILATNNARKERLAAIARDRLGYQEYLDLRESIDKNISSTYSKLQKKDVPKLAKKKKKGLDVNGNAIVNGAGGNNILPAPHPAALGLSPDDDHTLVVSEQLRQLVETRRQWVDAVGGVFEQKQNESPGRIWSLPKESIYDGIEGDVRRSIERSLEVVPLKPGEAKGEEKTASRGDEMDVG